MLDAKPAADVRAMLVKDLEQFIDSYPRAARYVAFVATELHRVRAALPGRRPLPKSPRPGEVAGGTPPPPA
jgi:hypothetical protein